MFLLTIFNLDSDQNEIHHQMITDTLHRAERMVEHLVAEFFERDRVTPFEMVWTSGMLYLPGQGYNSNGNLGYYPWGKIIEIELNQVVEHTADMGTNFDPVSLPLWHIAEDLGLDAEAYK